jgi:hypothetical protein
VTECEGTGFPFGFTAGAEYWLTRFLAAELGYLRPADVAVAGSLTGSSFESRLDNHIVTVSAKAGVPVGPVRIYGRVGANRHYGTLTTAQTIDDITITVDGVEQTFEGGTASIKGGAVGGIDGALNDRVTFLLFGGKLHLGL